jgi:hypothetical protein
MDRVRIFRVWRYAVFLLCVGIWVAGIATVHGARLFHHPVSYHLRNQCGKSRALSNARKRLRERARQNKHLVRMAKNRSKVKARVKNFSDRSNWRMSGVSGF